MRKSNLEVDSKYLLMKIWPFLLMNIELSLPFWSSRWLDPTNQKRWALKIAPVTATELDALCN